jgi:hypothetical protein
MIARLPHNPCNSQITTSKFPLHRFSSGGGGALGHLGLIVSVAAYAIVAPAHPWKNSESPGRAPTEIEGGTASQLSAERHRWEEAVTTFRNRATVEQSLKKQIITVFEPIYLEILNNDMVGFANTSAREMLEHLFLSYGSITAVDLERNFENMRKAWDPQQPVETFFQTNPRLCGLRGSRRHHNCRSSKTLHSVHQGFCHWKFLQCMSSLE